MDKIIELQGFDKLQDAFKRFPALVERELLKWVETTTAHLTDEITALTPVKEGTLRQSIKPTVTRVGRLGVQGIIGTPLNYAVPVELGSKPHDITPRNAKALHFMMRGFPVFAKRVHHPGSKGAFMFNQAFDENAKQVQASFERMIYNLLGKIAAGAV